MRILRAALGIAIIVQGIVAKETLTVLLGILLGGMAFLNLGYCGSNGCTVNSRPSKKSQEPEN